MTDLPTDRNRPLSRSARARNNAGSRCAPRRRQARPVLARRLQIRHAGHEGAGAGRLGGRARPCLRAVRLFRPWRIGRRVCRRHDRALAGRGGCGVRAFCRGPQVVIGSSMGGWMALLLARALPTRCKAGVAGRAGADRAGARFHRTADVERLSAEVREEIMTKGVWQRPSEYGDGALSDHPGADRGGPQASVAWRAIEVGCPVRILQGAQDPDVPWQHAFALAHRLPARTWC